MTIEEKSFQELIDTCNFALEYNPNPPFEIDIPNAYYESKKNKESNNKLILERETHYAYSLALGYYLTKESKYKVKCIEILKKWNNKLKNISSEDKSNYLYFVSDAINFVSAINILNKIHPEIALNSFGNLKTLFYLSSDRIEGRKNNWGSWGILGKVFFYSSNHYYNDGKLLKYKEKIYEHLKFSTLRIPLISGKNELWMENLRHNSGIWYTYFSLAPLCRAVMEIEKSIVCIDLWNELYDLLEKHFYYCKNPEKWPYKKLPWVLGMIQGLIFHGSSELDIPNKNSWPANLFEVMGKRLKNQDFISFGEKPLNCCNVFKYSTLITTKNLEKEIMFV